MGPVINSSKISNNLPSAKNFGLFFLLDDPTSRPTFSFLGIYQYFGELKDSLLSCCGVLTAQLSGNQNHNAVFVRSTEKGLC